MGRIPEYAGDIFQAPEGSVIIHACNCVGSWGAGFADALRRKFPAAFKVYNKWCLEPGTAVHQQGLLGTTLLIQPQPQDIPKSGRYWIACLFTSARYGAGKDKPAKILASTEGALESLKRGIQDAEGGDPGLNLHDRLFTVRINAKAFNTPWEQSRKLLENCGLEIAVVNNLELMGAAERSETIASMKAEGFDPATPPPFGEAEGGGQRERSNVESQEKDVTKRDEARSSEKASGPEGDESPKQLAARRKRERYRENKRKQKETQADGDALT